MMSGSNAVEALPSLTAPRKPSAMPVVTVFAGRLQRTRGTKPARGATCGWKTVPPFTVAAISTPSCSAEVAMPFAWLEVMATRSGGT